MVTNAKKFQLKQLDNENSLLMFTSYLQYTNKEVSWLTSYKWLDLYPHTDHSSFIDENLQIFK